jgi:hypothetical protein
MRGSELYDEDMNKVFRLGKIKVLTSFDTKSDAMLDVSSNDIDEITG